MRSLGPIWAAYSAGHHLTAFFSSRFTEWTHRTIYAERPPETIGQLPEWADQLDLIVDGLLEANLFGPNQAVRLQRLIGEWHQEKHSIFEDFRSAYIGWSDTPYSGWQNGWTRPRAVLKEVGELIKKAVDQDPYLTSWFRLGTYFFELLEQLSIDGNDNLMAQSFCAKLRAVDPDGRFQCTGLLADLLNAKAPQQDCPAAYKFFTFPDSGLELNDVELIFRNSLQNLVTPIWVVLRPQSVDFFSDTFQANEFRAAEWSLLRCFCERPNRVLSHEQLVKTAGLKCKPAGVPPHISRIRKKLQPAVDTFFVNSDPPANATMCFLVPWRPGNGKCGYQLDISAAHVRVEPDAKTSVRPV